MLHLRPYRSDRFVIHGRVGGVDHKLFQVIYRNQDGAVFVNLANYFAHHRGIAAHVLLPASGGSPVTVDLAGNPQTARLTSALLKYSHHFNGYAHFSQSGKIDRAQQIFRQAVPLSDVRGHLFTLHVRCMTDFRQTSVDPALVAPEKAAERSPIIFSFPEGDPGEVKFVGGWAPQREVLHEYTWAARDGVVGPIIRDVLGASLDQRVLLAPPLGTPSADSVLVLRCAKPPYPITEPASLVLLLGGFDPPSIVLDPDQDTRLLALKYPAERWEDLQVSLASMDARRVSVDEPQVETGPR